jgi:hypothetical protein
MNMTAFCDNAPYSVIHPDDGGSNHLCSRSISAKLHGAITEKAVRVMLAAIRILNNTLDNIFSQP